MNNDPIADLLTRIRNANKMYHAVVSIPFSNIKEKIVTILKEEGYIEKFNITGEKISNKNIEVTLKYKDTQRVISDLRRISKPGLRIYVNNNEIPKVLDGLGIALISTPKGIMTDKQARKQRLGGEVLAFVW